MGGRSSLRKQGENSSGLWTRRDNVQDRTGAAHGRTRPRPEILGVGGGKEKKKSNLGAIRYGKRQVAGGAGPGEMEL